MRNSIKWLILIAFPIFLMSLLQGYLIWTSLPEDAQLISITINTWPPPTWLVIPIVIAIIILCLGIIFPSPRLEDTKNEKTNL